MILKAGLISFLFPVHLVIYWNVLSLHKRISFVWTLWTSGNWSGTLGSQGYNPGSLVYIMSILNFLQSIRRCIFVPASMWAADKEWFFVHRGSQLVSFFFMKLQGKEEHSLSFPPFLSSFHPFPKLWGLRNTLLRNVLSIRNIMNRSCLEECQV